MNIQVIYTERQAIKERMEELKNERRELKNEYEVLLQRLRELDDREIHAYDVEGILSGLKETVQDLSKCIPRIPVDVAIEEFRKRVQQQEFREDTATEEKEEVKEESNLTEEFHKEVKRAQIPKRKKRQDVKKVISHIVMILKEAGRPMKTKEINEELIDQFGINYGNSIYQVVSQARQTHPNISQPSHGFYQYTFT